MLFIMKYDLNIRTLHKLDYLIFSNNIYYYNKKVYRNLTSYILPRLSQLSPACIKNRIPFFYRRKNGSWYIRQLLFLLVFTAMPLCAKAQEHSLTGRVTGEDNAPVPSANVILLSKDSVAIDWMLTDEGGVYRLEKINSGDYILKVSGLGYKPKRAEISIVKDMPAYNITLEQEMLDEVVVTQPRIERKVDRVVFNVQNTTLSNGDVWNVLSKTPYLMETGNTILVKGREEPLIFINDKRVHLSASELKQFLESTPANTLNSIEVILTPPAKYEAEGRTIVNIKMNKNFSIGYNGNINGSYEQGVYPKYRISTGHFYKTDKLNLYGGYSQAKRKTYAFFDDKIRFFTNNLPYGYWHSKTREVLKINSYNFNSNIDYSINDKHSLGLSGYASFIPDREEFTGSHTEAYDTPQQIDSSFYSVNRGAYIRDNIAASLDYTYNISDGKKLMANLHHTYYCYDNDQTITTDYFDSDQIITRQNAFTNDKLQYVRIYTAQADYSASTKQGDFEAGAKWSNISFDNTIEQVNITGNNADLSNLFLYDETNLHAYLSYEKNWERWDIKLGLRGENTNLKGVSISENETNTQDYFKIFPSVHLGYKPSDKHHFNFSYVKKISRPRFETLNPFRLFLNDNAYVTGNPNLLPTIDHKFNFVYTFDRSLTFDFHFERINNPILQLVFVDNENNTLIYRNNNLDKTIEYGVDGLWDKSLTPWWNISILSSVYYKENFFFAGQNSDNIINNKRWVTFQRVRNSFTLSKDKTFSGDIEFVYLSPSPLRNYIMGSRASLEIGLQKTLWNKRATLAFYANDIFNQLAFDTEARYLDQEIVSYSDFEYRTFEISFTYKFGNYKLRTNKKSIDKEERDRI